MKRNDIILFGVIILIGVIALASFYLYRSSGSKVVITVDGKEYKTLDLNKDTTVKIEGDHGDYNILVINDGVVDMIEANCPDKICVDHSSIHYNGETIVCLPHKVVLEIVGGEENETDMIAE